jgi:putative hydrolase of the HAD superfamily
VIETILFDLDDTLIAELEWARTGWALVARRIAPAVHREEAYLEGILADCYTADRRHVFDRFGARVGLDAGRIGECIELYRTGARALTVLPDAVAALRFAAARATGIVTDGLLASQRAKVAGAALAAAVGVVVYTDALGPDAGKPSPAGFAEALRQLDRPPQTAIYVADNAAKDFVGPRALGMRSVQVLRPDGVYAGALAPAGGEPDAVVDSLHDLAAVVRAWDDAVA